MSHLNQVETRDSSLTFLRVFVHFDCDLVCCFFFFQAEDGIRDLTVTGVQTCALPISEGRLKVTLNDHDTDPGCVAESLVHGGVKLIGLEEEELGLEEVFMRVTRGETDRKSVV